jgi:steroid delta-isomerase-like uncharacterized protein
MSCCGQEKQMGAEENRKVHTEWYEAENRLDLSHHEDYLHDDIEVCQAGVEPVVGIPAYCEMMESAYATLPDFHTVVDDQIATDTRVIARWRTSATHNSDSFGFPATGKPLTFSGISVWEFEGGKARRGWIYSNLPMVISQLMAP